MTDLERVRWEDDPEAFIILRLQESSDPDSAHKAFHAHLKGDAERAELSHHYWSKWKEGEAELAKLPEVIAEMDREYEKMAENEIHGWDAYEYAKTELTELREANEYLRIKTAQYDDMVTELEELREAVKAWRDAADKGAEVAYYKASGRLRQLVEETE